MSEPNELLLEVAERYRDLCIKLVGDVEELTSDNANLRVEREATSALLDEAFRQLGGQAGD